METTLSLTMVLTNVIHAPLEASSATSLSECLHQCYHSPTCATFFYDRVQNLCYPSQDLCSTLSQSLTERNDVSCYEWKHGDCPEHWSYHKPTGMCLQINTAGMTQTDAQGYCATFGGRLVNIDNSADNRIVKNIAKILEKGIWIGLRKKSGTWTWQNGPDLGTFTSWASGYPQSGEGCATMSSINLRWWSYDCGLSRRSLCEIVTQKQEMYCDI